MTDGFDEQTANLSNALNDILNMFPRGESIAADSRAMLELSEEAALAAPDHVESDAWGASPVRTAHSVASMKTVLAIDCAWAYQYLLRSESPVIFGIAPVARTSLENFARAKWLYEPSISTRLRVARAINDRIEGLYQQSLLPISEARQQAKDRLRRLHEVAGQLRYPLVDGPSTRRPQWVEEPRPSSTSLVADLIEFAENVGRVGYSFLSAVDHGLPHGLNEFIQNVESSDLGIYGRAEFALTAGTANTLTALLVMAAIPVLRSQHDFFGSGSNEVNDVIAAGLRAVINWSETTGPPATSGPPGPPIPSQHPS